MTLIRHQGGDARYFDKRLIDIIRGFGLDASLELCLDAGDGASYTSGQVWTDISGNARDFNRGATSGAEASDPTFNGSANGLSSAEYWSFDGGDYFTKASANDTFINSLHKNNAIATCCAWMYCADVTSANNAIFGTNRAGPSATGAYFAANSLSGDGLFWRVTNAGSAVATFSKGSNMTLNTWQFVAVSFDESIGASGALMMIDSSQTSVTSTYTSPAAGDATDTMQLAAYGNNVGPTVSGGRLGQMAMWSRTLSSAELLLIYDLTRIRYGV